MAEKIFRVIGLMSGTSLDGLDIAYCEFTPGKTWDYSIVKAETLSYPPGWKKQLMRAHELSGEELAALDTRYGAFLGEACKAFVKRHRLKPDFISSHGHTVFHQPGRGFTLQIGNGNAIHAASGLPVVSDFRTLDVARGGEGAPLVPIGDRLLFHDYDVCLNLGGIANISAEYRGLRRAFDVCFCNMAFNHLAAKTGKTMDKNGKLASRGQINHRMANQLKRFYASIERDRPSLGRELFEKRVKPILDNDAIPLADRMNTCVESAASEIVNAIRSISSGPRVLCTGGGTFNSFLLTRMLEYAGDDATLIVADDDVVAFKEALIFAFLGVLRLRGELNVLKSVTGASVDSCSGVLIGF